MTVSPNQSSSIAGFKFKSRTSVWESLRDRVAGLREYASRHKRVRNGALVALLLLGSATGVWAYIASRPMAVPNVLVDDLDDVMNYMLLSEEFNRLSLAQRRALLKDLVAKMKGMGSDDSAMMAAFAAGIMGPAREQLRKNAEKLMIDQWDEFAQQYERIPKDKRGDHLDKSLTEMTKLVEEIGGFKIPIKEEDRATRAKADAKRNKERNGNRVNTMREDMAMAAAQSVQRGSEIASPKQKARMALFMRDMTRHLRGEDPETGKPIEPPVPPEDPTKEKDKEKQPEDPNNPNGNDPNGSNPAAPGTEPGGGKPTPPPAPPGPGR
jgi:hypothetical protein